MGFFDKATDALKGAVEKATEAAVGKKQPPAPEAAPVPDVVSGSTAAAEAGLETAKKAEAPAAKKAPAKKPAAKKAPAKKAAAKKATPKHKTVTVVKGDTLSEIAAKHSVDWREMAKLNKLENPDLIFPGQVFKIPNK